MTIESKGYVATAGDIEALVKGRLEASNTLPESRRTYLRALIATTQAKLGIKPQGVRTGKAGTAEPDVIGLHSAALEEVHLLFYEAVQKAAREVPIDEEEMRARSDVIASRIVFARTAYSTVRAWLVRGKHGMNHVNASKATKAMLREQTPERKLKLVVSPRIRRESLFKQMKLVLDKIMLVGQSDKESAIAVLHDIINMLSHGFDDLGHKADKLRAEVDHTATGVITAPTPRRKAA